jgi:hypothetical protein
MSIPSDTPPPTDPNTPPAKIPTPPRRGIPPGFIIALLALVAVLMVFGPLFDRTQEISYGFFRKELDKKNIATLDLQERKVVGEFIEPPQDPSNH